VFYVLPVGLRKTRGIRSGIKAVLVDCLLGVRSAQQKSERPNILNIFKGTRLLGTGGCGRQTRRSSGVLCAGWSLNRTDIVLTVVPMVVGQRLGL